ncbi:MAG: NF038143 family protein [Desulfohalobiaceae bacterium]
MGNQELSQKYRWISQEEIHFLRTLATYIRAKTPQPFWHWLIPFKFALEMLARNRMTEDFSKNVFQARQLALDSAYALQQGEDRESVLQKLEGNLQKWLQGQNLYTQEILDQQMQLAELFIEHYSRLFQAQGKGYKQLVQNAYAEPSAYENFLQQVSNLEQEIDKQVLQVAGPRIADSSKLERNIRVKHEALQETRAKEVQRTFFK